MGTQVRCGIKLPRVICQKRIKSSRRKKEGTLNSQRACHLQWLEEMQISRVGRGKVREAPCGAFYLRVSGMRFSSGHEIPV